MSHRSASRIQLRKFDLTKKTDISTIDQSGSQSDEQPDDQKCILISGDFPKGLNPRNKKHLGKNVIIKAVVIYQDGFLNLKNISR